MPSVLLATIPKSLRVADRPQGLALPPLLGPGSYEPPLLEDGTASELGDESSSEALPFETNLQGPCEAGGQTGEGGSRVIEVLGTGALHILATLSSGLFVGGSWNVCGERRAQGWG